MSEILEWFAIAIVMVALLFGIYALAAVFEARSFRKLTGRTDVTWFDALWVELRVIDCSKPQQ